MEYETIYINRDDPNFKYDYAKVQKRQFEVGACVRLILKFHSWLVEYTVGIGHGYKNHRLGGPAIISLDGPVNPSQRSEILFYVNDRWYLRTDEYCEAAGMSDEETFMWVLRFGDELPRTIEGFYGDCWKDMAMEDF